VIGCDFLLSARDAASGIYAEGASRSLAMTGHPNGDRRRLIELAARSAAGCNTGALAQRQVVTDLAM